MATTTTIWLNDPEQWDRQTGGQTDEMASELNAPLLNAA